MYKILEKQVLSDVTKLMVVEAPHVARKARAGQFVIVIVDEQGERSFSFYRPPAADLLFRAGDFAPACFEGTGVFHVCSNSLTEAAIAEATCDDMGLAWPSNVAPFDVHVVIAGKGADLEETGERFAQELGDAGLNVLLDDRPKVSPGVKFKDAELLGMPLIVTVGKKLSDGVVEIRQRKTGASLDVPLTSAVQQILATRNV